MFSRRRFDPQPSGDCRVLLASDGRQAFSEGAVARAAALADGGSVAVVAIAKIYGSSFGLPHPGLLPTREEIAERQEWVADAITTLHRNGIDADGQVAATRRATRKLAEIARVRGAQVVVMDETQARGLRRVIEGDVGHDLRRPLRRHGVQSRSSAVHWPRAARRHRNRHHRRHGVHPHQPEGTAAVADAMHREPAQRAQREHADGLPRPAADP